jgi:hypothetical protein
VPERERQTVTGQPRARRRTPSASTSTISVALDAGWRSSGGWAKEPASSKPAAATGGLGAAVVAASARAARSSSASAGPDVLGKVPSRRRAASFAVSIASEKLRFLRNAAKPCATPAVNGHLLDRLRDRGRHGADGGVGAVSHGDGVVGDGVELVELVVDAVDRAAGLDHDRQGVALGPGHDDDTCRTSAEPRAKMGPDAE